MNQLRPFCPSWMQHCNACPFFITLIKCSLVISSAPKKHSDFARYISMWFTWSWWVKTMNRLTRRHQTLLLFQEILQRDYFPCLFIACLSLSFSLFPLCSSHGFCFQIKWYSRTCTECAAHRRGSNTCHGPEHKLTEDGISIVCIMFLITACCALCVTQSIYSFPLKSLS